MTDITRVEFRPGQWQTTFQDSGRKLEVCYVFSCDGWIMLPVFNGFDAESIPLLESAIHELKRLNGTLPPVRIGGMRPEKGGK